MPCACEATIQERAVCACGEGPVILRRVSVAEHVERDGLRRRAPRFEVDGRILKRVSEVDARIQRTVPMPRGQKRPGSRHEGSHARQSDGWTHYLTQAIELEALAYMSNNSIPNGAITVISPEGKLVYCKALTWCPAFPAPSSVPEAADVPTSDDPFYATVHTRFRIASVSKTITAVAILKLVEEGKVAGPIRRVMGISQAAVASALQTGGPAA